MHTWPQSGPEWARAIEAGLGHPHEELQTAYDTGRFPYGQLEAWIRETYGDGYAPGFVPTLLRNKLGLIAWTYGEGAEPHWPGSD